MDSYSSIGAEGWDQSLHEFGQILLIYPADLAYIYQHNNITPKGHGSIEYFHEEGCRYQVVRGYVGRLLHSVNYGKMKKRPEQAFEYHFGETEGQKALRRELQWLLARLTYLPTP
ncbi:Secondary metabolism regulator LAE1 [Fusarium oxysporum f. sp. albedinis]|nr:Secondary metabolism regulator LAE1 [Fusarium oxysporum f. sp. albedinis]